MKSGSCAPNGYGSQTDLFFPTRNQRSKTLALSVQMAKIFTRF